ncbi:MAG TPA: DUF1553 domain-containing protein [Vicinamibacterales bacterium]|jgi:hypothetical protein
MRTVLVAFVLVLAAAWPGADLSAAPATGTRQSSPLEPGAAPPIRNTIDTLVFGRLKQLNVQPARLCSDAVFVRRVFLDVIGTLPTADETRAFIDETSPTKRQALIDRLLQRDEFADYWAMKWCDALRVKSEFPINLWPNAVQAYHRWIRTAIRDNLPYDRFARELLTASGSNFRVAPVNFYRATQSREPRAIAAMVAETFMGARIENWPAERVAGLAAFFSQIGYKNTGEWKEEIVFFDPDKARAPTAGGQMPAAVFPDGTAARLSSDQDPREVFAAWLVSPENPWFARSLVNRIWFWLLGRGIVHEPDDIRPDNPATHSELLAYLERELVAARFDPKSLYRLILNSSTYQLSAVASGGRADADTYFAAAVVRPLDAEVLIDAIVQITGSAEQYSSPIPEPFTFIPPDQRAIALADGSIRSAFLETFGRPARDTGRAAERTTRPTAAQRLYLLNSTDIQRKLQQGPKLQALLQTKGDAREIATTLYLTILSRPPTDEELKIATGYARSVGGNRRAAVQDLAWALINTAEFRYRH